MLKDWAHLPEDLVRAIAQKLSAIKDHVCFRAVCKGWEKGASPSSCHLPRQAPWLMLPRPAQYVNNECFPNDSVLSFYDPYQLRVRSLFGLPQCHRATFIHGSSYGWLVLEHENRVWLYNPINRREIDGLPPLSCPFSDVERYDLCIEMVVLSCNPSNTESCVVAVWFQPDTILELVFCRIGDRQWTVLKMTNVGPDILDFTVHNNSVCTTNDREEITVYDLQSPAVRTISLESIQDGSFMIDLVKGGAESDGLHLVRASNIRDHGEDVSRVYKWNNDSQEWLVVTNMTNRAIYESRRQCFDLQVEEEHGNRLYWSKVIQFGENPYSVLMNWLTSENGIFDMNSLMLKCLDISPIITGYPSWFTPSLM